MFGLTDWFLKFSSIVLLFYPSFLKLSPTQSLTFTFPSFRAKAEPVCPHFTLLHRYVFSVYLLFWKMLHLQTLCSTLPPSFHSHAFTCWTNFLEKTVGSETDLFILHPHNLGKQWGLTEACWVPTESTRGQDFNVGIQSVIYLFCVSVHSLTEWNLKSSSYITMWLWELK